MGELDELTAALQDDEKRRRLEEKAVALSPSGLGKTVLAGAIGCDRGAHDGRL